MTPLPEQAAEYAAEKAAPGSVAERAIRRAYMAGALAALTSKARREQMLRECFDFGRAIGTAAEAARTTPTS